MSYWSYFEGEVCFRVPEAKKGIVDSLVYYLKWALTLYEEDIKMENDSLCIRFRSSWKNNDYFLEDLLRAIEKRSEILNCSIKERGEESEDKWNWSLNSDGVIHKVRLIKEKEKSVQKRDIEMMMDSLSEDIGELYSFELHTENKVDFVLSEYLETDYKSFEVLLEKFPKEFGDGSKLTFTNCDNVTYRISFEENMFHFYEMEEMKSKDIFTLEKVVSEKKKLFSIVSNITGIKSDVYLSEFDDAYFETKKFETKSGKTVPLRPEFLTQYFWNEGRKEKEKDDTHIDNEGNPCSICDFCDNKLKKLIDGCFDCKGAAFDQSTPSFLKYNHEKGELK